MSSMSEDLLELARLKEQQTNIGNDIKEVESRLVGALEAKGQKTVSANNGDLTGTLVKSSTITIDAEKLKKALGPALWKKVTKQVLDNEKLEAHIVTGDVDPNVVASVSTEKDRKPYVRVTGTFRPKKSSATPKRVSTKNSAGGNKPAVRRVKAKRKT